MAQAWEWTPPPYREAIDSTEASIHDCSTRFIRTSSMWLVRCVRGGGWTRTLEPLELAARLRAHRWPICPTRAIGAHLYSDSMNLEESARLLRRRPRASLPDQEGRARSPAGVLREWS